MSTLPLEERLVLFFKSEKYREMLREASVKKRRSIPVEFNDLIKFDEEFAKRLIDNPNVMLNILSRACFRQLQIEDPQYASAVRQGQGRHS
jgi:DNA replicative helicase MCM subunit Mcm2 (Cdc46/Mcm family)